MPKVKPSTKKSYARRPSFRPAGTTVLADSTLPRNWIIKCMPANIWRLTFNISVEIDLQNCTFSLRNAPVLLSHVCSTWRKIVFNAPELWHRVAVQVNGYGDPCPHIDILRHALFYAQGCPLTISIFENPSGHIHDPSVVFPYLQIIHRAKRLELNADIIDLFTDCPKVFRAVEAKWEGAKPLLEELVFRRGCAMYPINQAISNIWMPSPKLHTLIIQCQFRYSVSWTSLVDGPYFPFHQLSMLKIESETSAVHFLTILSETKNLIRCDIGPIVGELPSDSGDKPLLLTALQEVKLSGSEDSQTSPPLTRLLRYIRTPALTRLSLRHDRDWSHSSFAFFILHSSCNIRDLTLDINIFGEEEKVHSMQLLPSLQTLRIRSLRGRRNNCFAEMFMNAMKRSNASHQAFCLFEELETIEIDYYPFIQARNSTATFADMIEARCRLLPPSNPFKRIIILGNLESKLFSCEFIRILMLKGDGLSKLLDPQGPVLQSLICH